MGRTRSILSPQGEMVALFIWKPVHLTQGFLTNSGREVGWSLAWSLPDVIANTTDKQVDKQERRMAHRAGGREVQHGDTGAVPPGKSLFLVYTWCLLAVSSPGGRLKGYPGALNLPRPHLPTPPLSGVRMSTCEFGVRHIQTMIITSVHLR